MMLLGDKWVYLLFSLIFLIALAQLVTLFFLCRLQRNQVVLAKLILGEEDDLVRDAEVYEGDVEVECDTSL